VEVFGLQTELGLLSAKEPKTRNQHEACSGRFFWVLSHRTMAKLINARARYDYETLQTFDAGMVLHGWEVKSLRKGDANIKPAWVKVAEDGLWLENLLVSPYQFSSLEMIRDRSKKLLVTKKEIAQIAKKVRDRGITIIPIKVFKANGVLKCQIAVVKGRKRHEKKQHLKERDMDRRAKAAMKQY
jgi:SsrA-binding protein